MKFTVKAMLAGAGLMIMSPAGYTETLGQAVQLALQNHPDIKIAKNQKHAIEHEWRIAKAGYRPTVDLATGYGVERAENNTTRNRAGRNGTDGEPYRTLNRYESSLTASQMLFDGFETSSEICQQKERFNSARYNVMEAEEAVSLAAVEAYVEVLRNMELVAIAKDNYSTHLRYLKQIKQRAEGGRGNMADVRQADGRVALIRANLQSAEGDLANAKANYLEVVGKLPEGVSLPTPPVEVLPSTIDDAIARAIANNPALGSAQHDIKAAKAAKRTAKASFYPRFDAELEASHDHNQGGVSEKGTDRNYQAMVRMRYNLYRGGADTARVRERASRVQEARESLERDRRLVEEGMYVAWNNLETARTRIQPLSQHVMASDATRKAYGEQFDIGQRSLLDLLDSEIEFYSARTALVNAKYALDFAVYNVLAQSGELANTVGGQRS